MTRRVGYPRRGVVLLEVLLALVILTVAGVAAVTLTATATRAMARARERDSNVRTASAFLDAVALWSREDLDRHLGSRIEGRWRLFIDRSWPSVYAVRLVDTLSAETLLETSLYRPANLETPNAP